MASKRTRLWFSWHDMVSRCYDSNHRAFAWYGGRGIDVCERWLDPITSEGSGKRPTQGFLNFLEDMGETWFAAVGKEAASLDRIDNDRGYYADNCQWITRSENSRKMGQQRVYQRTHHFLDGDLSREVQQKRVQNGTHNLLGPHSWVSNFSGSESFTVLNIKTLIFERVSKREYWEGKGTLYAHANSKEAKTLKSIIRGRSNE